MKIINAVGKSSFKLNNKTYYINNDNSQLNENMGKVIGIVLHWTAGDQKTFYNGYPINIGFIDNEVIVVKTIKFTQKGQHVWQRNSGLLGIALCAMKVWIIKPNEYQLDIMSLFIAEYCSWNKLDPEKTISLPEKKLVGITLVNTGRNKNFPIISDHRTFAEADGYGSERQDILNYYQPVREKAIQYYKELKNNKRKFQFLEILKEG